MKKISFLVAALAAVCMAVSGCEKVIPAASLPQEVQTFIRTNFEGVAVSYAKSSPGEYEVLLMDGSELEFNKNGQWKSVEMKHSAVPACVLAMLPASILSYVEASFPGVPFEKVKKLRRGYKVELANDLELTFNGEGVFKSIDD